MPSPRFHVRKRVHTPDPRLHSDGRCRSPSPRLLSDGCRSPSPRLLSDGCRSPSPRILSDGCRSPFPRLLSGGCRSPSPRLLSDGCRSPSPRILSDGCRSPSPRLLSDGCRSPSPRLLSDGRPSAPLDKEPTIAQIILMFAMEDPRPDPDAVKFLLHELETVGLPYHVIFNKIDLVEPEVISEWESRLLSWGSYPTSFVSLRGHLGLYDLDDVLSGRSSLVLGLHNVGKTSLVQYVTKHRASQSKYDVSTVIKQAGKWLTEKCDISNLMKEDLVGNTILRPYCIDLYKDMKSENGAFLVRPKGWIVQRLLEIEAPILDEMAEWVFKKEKTEEYLYFTKFCPEDERSWWRSLTEKKGLCSPQKKLEKDFQLRGMMDRLLMQLYKGCYKPCKEDAEMLRDLLPLVNESPRLSSGLACGAAFIATCVILMMVGQEPVKIAAALLLHALADSHYDCKILIGQLGGFHAVTEMIRAGCVDARKAGIQLLGVLVDAEENWRKVLVTGVPEALIGVLAEDGDDTLGMVTKIFNHLGSFELAWNRFFTATFERLSASTSLHNALMHALVRIRHAQNLSAEYLEGAMHCERDDDMLQVEGVAGVRLLCEI